MTAIGLILFSCATASDPVPSQPPIPPSAQTVPDNAVTECVAACIKTNMARAVAPEIIESDCTRSCSAENDGRGLIFENQHQN